MPSTVEEWRDIPGYEGYYQASNLGRLRSLDQWVSRPTTKPYLKRGRVLKLTNGSEYQVVMLRSGGAQYVHRLIASTFFGACPEGRIVLHGERGAFDNSVSNLRYGSYSQNMLDRNRDGTNTRAKAVRRSDGQVFPSMCVAQKETGVYQANISKVCLGERTMAGGFGWEYV